MRRLVLLLGLVGLGTAGCDDSGSATKPPLYDGGGSDAAVVPRDGAPLSDGPAVACPTGAGNGQLTVTVSAPIPLTPELAVVGGALTAPMPIAAGTPVTLPGGPGYQLLWKRVKAGPAIAGGLVGRAFYLSGTTFDGCIKGAVSATVTFTQEPGSEKLWMALSNAPSEIAAMGEAALRAGGAQAPVVTRTMHVNAGSDTAFDRFGNLWLSDSGVGGGIQVYPMLTLGTSGTQPPALKLLVEQVVAFVFDTQGSLWAVQRVPGGTDRIVKFLETDLTFDGAAIATANRTPTPAVTITSPDMNDPKDLAFDAAGNLWVASGNVLKFGAAQIAATYAGPAQVVLQATYTGPVSGAYSGADGLLFDKAGGLWVSWLGALTKFTTAQLAATATIANPFHLDPMGMGPAGVSTRPLAFDAGGGLWLFRGPVGMDQALVRMAPAALTAGGMQSPDRSVVSAALGYVNSLSFGPAEAPVIE